MLTHDAAEDPRASEFIDPVNVIDGSEEAPNEYREAARRLLPFMHSALSFIDSGTNEREKHIRLKVVESALDHPNCEGLSDTELAAKVSTSRANFSKYKLQFQRENNLSPTLNQKSPEARDAYRKSRHEQLKRNHSSN